MTPPEAVVWRSAGELLCYPDGEFGRRLPLVLDALDGLPGAGSPWAEAGGRLAGFARYAAGRPPGELAADYVATFDLRRRCCLYLTYFTDGDTRRRGTSLARLKETYRAAGFAPAGGELPDYLPMVLEFASALAAEGSPDGRELLGTYRPALELLRIALRDRRSPYLDVLEALCVTVPSPPGAGAAARELAQAGPPVEAVGLETYQISARRPV